MPNDYEFDDPEIIKAFERADERCECPECRKRLSKFNQGRGSGWGAWEAHHGGREAPVILCTGEPENCHLNCGHGGHWHNVGITPRVHRGG
jgi:hypothetical protein